MTTLSRGGNAPLTASMIAISVAGALQGVVDLMAFALTAERRVRTDSDFVYFNQPSSPEGAVRLVDGDRLTVSLGTVPPEIDCIAVAVALDEAEPGSLALVAGLGVNITDGAATLLAPATGLTTERAAVLVEVYRRAGGWKVRCVSAGWSQGLAALVREHGVSVDDDPAPDLPADSRTPVPAPRPAESAAGPATPAPPQPRSVPGEERLSLVKRTALNMRKQEVHRVLLTKGAAGERARIVVVIDKTGSMYAEFKSKLVHRVVERMVPVAIQLDDDGSIECYLYAKSFARLPDLRVVDLETWPEEYLHLGGKHGGIDYKKIGGYNDEIPILTEVISTARAGGGPTLVLFFTDGGFSKKKEITQLMRKASALPIFWQFVGIGANNYGLLTTLDEMDGRVVDNVGFFALDDIDKVDDAELYRRLLGEFPEWLRAARNARIL